MRKIVLCLVAVSLLTVGLPSPSLAESSTADAPVDGLGEQGADARAKVLQAAFDSACTMPLHPHIKTRSRLQQELAFAWIEMGRPAKAVSCIEDIADWRAGLVHAQLAFHYAQEGNREQAGEHLAEAMTLARETTVDWGRDRTLARVIDSYVLLGESEQTEALLEGLDPSEIGKDAIVRAAEASAEDISGEMEVLKGMIEEGLFDGQRHALDALVIWYGRPETDPALRQEIETLVLETAKELPGLFFQFLYREKLADAEIGLGNPQAALDLADEIDGLVSMARWPYLHDRYMWEARILALRARAGKGMEVQPKLEELVARYEEESDSIVNIWRADALRPIAEAFVDAGDPARAIDVYVRALEVSLDNPNSRPRLEDLVATSISIVAHDVEPTPELWDAIENVRSQLGDPW